MKKFNPNKYILVDYKTFSSMLKGHRTIWRNWNHNLIGSGMRRIYNSSIMKQLQDHYKSPQIYTDLSSHMVVLLEITNKKKAMLTRIKFGI